MYSYKDGGFVSTADSAMSGKQKNRGKPSPTQKATILAARVKSSGMNNNDNRKAVAAAKASNDAGNSGPPIMALKNMPGFKEGGNWIAGATKNKGALHKQLGVPSGEKISAGKLAAAAKAPGKKGKRARLAQTLAGLNK